MYFFLILLFIVGVIFGFFSVGLTTKGSDFLWDLWAKVRSFFSKKPDLDAELIFEEGNIDEFRSNGGIKPIDGYITWYIDPSKLSRTISQEDAVIAINNSFKHMHPHMNGVKFKRVVDKNKAQVVVGFWLTGQKGLPQAFGSNTLAYAYLGNGTESLGIVGDIYVNDRYPWSKEQKPGYVNFEKVFLHENLHASMGGHHQTIDPTGILYPSYSARNPIKLIQDTIDLLDFVTSQWVEDGSGTPTDDDPADDDPTEDCPDCPECPECPKPTDCTEHIKKITQLKKQIAALKDERNKSNLKLTRVANLIKQIVKIFN